MLILGLIGMYFDAAVVFVTRQTLLFRLALAILCTFSILKKTSITISTVAGIIHEFVGCHGLALVLYVIGYMQWSLVDEILNICEEN